MVPSHGKRQPKLNAIMFAMLMADLIEGPCTAQQLVDHTGMHLDTVYRILLALYARKVIRVAGYERGLNGRNFIRVFGMGPGRDADKPFKSKAQVRRDYRARQAARRLAAGLALNP